MSLILKELEEIAKCCVCIELLQPPVTMCKNGHAICSVCKHSMTVCPTCKVKFLLMTPVTLNNILSAFPKLCQNSIRGCNRLLTKYSLTDHEERCRSRIEHCRLTDCSWSGNVSCLLDHIQLEHDDQCVFNSTNECYWANPVLNEHSCDVSIANAFDCLFWKYECTNLKKNKLLIFVQCLLLGDDVVNNFYSTISFTKPSFPIQYTYSQKCVNGNVNIEEIFEKEDCMAVPLDSLPLLIEKDGKLNYSFHIISL